MLKTLKQLKGMLKMNFHFWVEGGNGRENILNALTSKNEIDAKFVQSHLSEIKQLIVNNKSWDFFSLNDLMRKYNLSNSDYLTLNEKFKVITNVLWLPEWEIKVQNYVTAIERVQKGTKSELSSVRTDVSNTRLPKTSWNIWYQDIVWKSKTKWIKLESQGYDVVSNFDENRDKWNKNLVRKLQRELWVKVDGIFWKNTRAALNAARGNNWKGEIANSQYAQWVTPLNFWETSYAEYKATSNELSENLDYNKAAMRIVNEMNKNLEKYYYRKEAWSSIYDLISHYILGKNEYDALVNNLEANKSILWDKNKKALLEEAAVFLTWWETKKRWLLAKHWAWLAWIYLFDLPIPFISNGVPWADPDKAILFKPWVKSLETRNISFEDYYNQNKNTSVRDLNRKQFEHASSAMNVQIDPTNQYDFTKDLNNIDMQTTDMLLTYWKEVLYPSLKKLYKASYWNFLNIQDQLFDSKAKNMKKYLEDLEKVLKNKDLKWLRTLVYWWRLDQVLDDLYKEGDVNPTLVDWVTRTAISKWREDYANESVQQTLGILSQDKDLYNKYAKLYNFVNLADVIDMVPDKDKSIAKELVEILAFNKHGSIQKLDLNKLRAWDQKYRNTWVFKFISSLWNEKELKEYYNSTIPKPDRKLIDFNSPSKGAHGRDLSRYTNQEALEIAEREWKDGMSTLWLAYKSFVNMWLSWVTYDEFRNGFGRKEIVDIDDAIRQNMWKQILNTGRHWWAAVTSFEGLKNKYKDKNVFKININKEYTTLEWSTMVKVKWNYDLYMRPNCTNPLIVPGSIKVEKNGKQIPDSEMYTVAETIARFPIVIPWTVFRHKKPSSTPEKTPPTPTPPLKTPPPGIPPIKTPPTPTPDWYTIPGYTDLWASPLTKLPSWKIPTATWPVQTESVWPGTWW